MAIQLFNSNIIAIVWDFDQTLIPDYQQGPIFREYDVDAREFWRETNSLQDHYESGDSLKVSQDTIYLSHMLSYVEHGIFSGLSNEKLRNLGKELEFYIGMPDLLKELKELIEQDVIYRKHDIKVEHYIISTGLRQMILGSAVAPFVDGVWACEFIETPAKPGFLDPQGELPINDDEKETEISQVGYFLDNTTKTRAIWEINKGTNIDPRIGVNDRIAEEDRRVPLRNMLYIADGPSDIPVFSIINKYGGRTLGVFNPGSDEHFRKVKMLQDQGRVNHFSEANYETDSQTSRWIKCSLKEMADNIVQDREALLSDRVSGSPTHVTE